MMKLEIIKTNKSGIKREGVVNKQLTNTYGNMLDRCYNKNSKDYINYGKRGIVVDARWLGTYGFSNFCKDVGDKPKGKTLNRINNDFGYNKDNCEWATAMEQANNRRNSKYYTYKGETNTTRYFSTKYDIPYSLLKDRLIKSKMSITKAIELPKRTGKTYNYNNEELTLSKLSIKYNIKLGKLETRVNQHKWNIKRAIETP